MNRLLLSLAALLANLGATSAAPAPNVIVFFIDDLGWSDLGCYGSTFYETPNLDRLASSGVRFTHSYSANPVCSPTRAAAMTGKAPQRVGITQWIPQPSDVTLPKEETTLGEAFREAGYATGYTGKWHLGEKDDQLPNSHGFTWMKATNRAGQPASYFYPYAKKNKRGSYWNVPDLSSGEPSDYLSDALTDQAIHFIDRHQAQPFFLYLAHYAVHTPIQAPKSLVAKYQKKRHQRYGDSPTPTVPGPHETVSRGRQDHPAYAAMIENLDRNIGRVLDRVKQLGLEENTIIVFTSDNGGHCHLKNSPGVTSNLPLRSGKGWTYEGGIRIPTIIAWPGKIAPATSQVPSITMDLFPTLLELSGQPLLPEQHLDGRSLVSALDGQPKAALKSRALYWTYPHAHGSGHQPSHAIQKDGWKLIHFDADQSDALYHLERDIREQHDLAGKHPEKVQALREELMDWIKKTTP
ncbi:sulfatase [Verrucomicrobiaceae bacterium 5K15]|uniref:Sulfatase n=1 Tax=Oceaniferula flava TaxID=2800421 RepID=A0AAE2SDC9_9BACT|nr:sulfatase [Oceaniferula flavus]MBK1854784.1 sulfatase [Oceaniferula flavus]MBM1136090.1 sulfatase [Oceaniferula flavus]